jgi:hypothetical protein
MKKLSDNSKRKEMFSIMAQISDPLSFNILKIKNLPIIPAFTIKVINNDKLMKGKEQLQH